MTQIGFYHLTQSPLEQALPKLLDKALAAGYRAVVLAGSPQRVEALNDRLWSYEPDSWLPHGSDKDGEAASQPIWLTDKDENPNAATILVMCDGVRSAAVADFARCLDLFDGNDDEAVQAARDRWKRWKGDGHELVYYQQRNDGGWEEKSRS
ncbi:MAG: DNA polymerase III subunit chi [Phaeospirillum sp.]|nr:DNA polymerase III subunit chi [Phaeospirillum sp.]